MRWLVLVALSACGGKSEDPAPGSATNSTTPQQDKLTVTVDGKPIAIQRAFIKRLSADNWRVSISDLEGSCPELLSSTTDVKPGAHTYTIDVAKQYAPDGKQQLAIYEFATVGDVSNLEVPVELIGSSDAGKTATITLPEITDRPGTTKVRGTLVATGCGDAEPPPVTRRTAAATLTVNGQKLDIKAVALFPDNDLAISTEPLDCKMITPAAPIVLWHDNRQWQLGGSWISRLRQPVANDADAKQLVIEIGKATAARDGKVAPVALHGTAELRDFHDQAGYKIELAGKVEAVDCRDTK